MLNTLSFHFLSSLSFASYFSFVELLLVGNCRHASSFTSSTSHSFAWLPWGWNWGTVCMVGRNDLAVLWLEVKHGDDVEKVLDGVSSEDVGCWRQGGRQKKARVKTL